MDHQSPPLIILTGPTGVGKTAFSNKMAQRLPIEIINCDVGQLYEPLSIGTAKPDWRHEKVPHHLFDHLEEPVNFSVTAYRALVMKAAQEVAQRGNVPVLVGGSLFYIRSLFFPPLYAGNDNGSPSVSAPVLSPQELWQKLYAIDPQRAEEIEPHDGYRIARALKIWKATGKKPSQLRPEFSPPGNFYLAFVNRNRSELYERINSRFDQMFKEGWVEEVAGLRDERRDFLMEKRLIGYPEIIACLRSSSVQDCANDHQLITTIKKKTRNYAKRQVTFWRMLKRQIEYALAEQEAGPQVVEGVCREFDLTLSSVDLYLDHVVQSISQMQGAVNE